MNNATPTQITLSQEFIDLAEKLNAQSAEAKDALALVNEKLATRNVEVEVWLGPLKQDHESYQLGYGRVGDRWQLATRTCEAEADEEVNQFSGEKEWVAVPGSYGPSLSVMLAAPAIRVEMLELLPVIISELKSEMKRKVELRQEAIETAFQL
jgi:hypothetical protein